LGEELRDVSSTGKVRPWRRLKEQGLAVAAAFEGFDAERGEKMRRCASYAKYVWGDDAAGVVHKKLREANFCRCRMCPGCTTRLSHKRGFELSMCFEHVANKEDMVAVMMTLTPRSMHRAKTKRELKMMQAAWKKMREWPRFRRAMKYWYRGTEMTFPGETVHPHIHVMGLVPKKYFDKRSGLFLHQREIAEKWGRCLGADYTPVVDIRRMRKVVEAAKYVAKPSDYLTEGADGWVADAEILEILNTAVHSYHLSGWSKSFSKVRHELGFLKKGQSDDDEDVDLIGKGEGLPEGVTPRGYLKYSWFSTTALRGMHRLVEMEPYVEDEGRAAKKRRRKEKREREAEERRLHRDLLRATGRIAVADVSICGVFPSFYADQVAAQQAAMEENDYEPETAATSGCGPPGAAGGRRESG